MVGTSGKPFLPFHGGGISLRRQAAEQLLFDATLCSLSYDALPNMVCPQVIVNSTLMPKLQYFSISAQYTSYQVCRFHLCSTASAPCSCTAEPYAAAEQESIALQCCRGATATWVTYWSALQASHLSAFLPSTATHACASP